MIDSKPRELDPKIDTAGKWVEIFILLVLNIVSVILVVGLNYIVHYCGRTEDPERMLRKYTLKPRQSSRSTSKSAKPSAKHPNPIQKIPVQPRQPAGKSTHEHKPKSIEAKQQSSSKRNS